MATLMSKRDLDEFRPVVDDIVMKVLGFSEPSVTIAALNCVSKGMNKMRTTGMYSSKPYFILQFLVIFVHTYCDIAGRLAFTEVISDHIKLSWS